MNKIMCKYKNFKDQIKIKKTSRIKIRTTITCNYKGINGECYNSGKCKYQEIKKGVNK
jgi:hypothetical protein